jgi:tyrosyl-DNA phosphodiesterase-1
MEVPASVKNELLLFDFSKAKAQIVASVSGVFEGERDYRKYGHTRLADVVNNITNGNKEEKSFPNKIEMQVKSSRNLHLSSMFNLYRTHRHPHLDQ